MPNQCRRNQNLRLARNPKKQGAQPGHKRNIRLLIPTDQCDHVLPLRPSQCRRCKRKLTGIDPDPLRHQVFEIPAPKPVITEYQQHRLTCSCGTQTFTEVKGIEPTNNPAERALRPAVIQRKLSFGTQSESGSRFLERMLTVSETCRLQQRSPYQYLVAVMEAKFNNQPAPSLLPPDYNQSKNAA